MALLNVVLALLRGFLASEARRVVFLGSAIWLFTSRSAIWLSKILYNYILLILMLGNSFFLI